jgi:hypothetical protein
VPHGRRLSPETAEVDAVVLVRPGGNLALEEQGEVHLSLGVLSKPSVSSGLSGAGFGSGDVA